MHSYSARFAPHSSEAPPLRALWILILLLGACSETSSEVDGTTGQTDLGQPDLALPDIGPAGTGGSGGLPGHTMQDLTYNGTKRAFAVHVPPKYDGKTPVPLLLHFHGWRPAPVGVSDELKYLWGSTADAEIFIAVAPEGQPCAELNPSDPYYCFRQTDDGLYVAELIKHLGQLYNLRPDRIFIAGHSGGAFFVQGHGLSSSSTYVAAVTFSGGCIISSDQYGNSCSVYTKLSAAAPRKIPYFVAHTDTDQVVPTSYSAELLKLLKAGGHPTSSESKYDGGTYGHSVDPVIIPKVWAWLAGFQLTK